ncbi:MAG: PHP domain-containing protein [Candidatus Omnitrophica bacterium]|nr:PHP domain-containing protein [Candidatus Omnitrophota bacterium]
MRSADLHTHTNYSDGTATPEELIAEAVKAGLSAVAITDHDTVEGVERAIAASAGGQVEVLPGIELTSEHEGLEIHLLGYLLDHRDKSLLERLQLLKKNRVDRIYRICDKLKALGLSLAPEKVFDLSAIGTVGRLHVAQAMVKEGLVNSTYEAFNKYIGDKCPAYVANFKLSPQEAIGLILKFSGIPVLAHPYSMGRDDLIPRFAEYGLMGLEVYYLEHTRSMVDSYLHTAKKLNLLVTGGSDYHGKSKPNVYMGAMKIPYELVEKLKEAKARAD